MKRYQIISMIVGGMMVAAIALVYLPSGPDTGADRSQATAPAPPDHGPAAGGPAKPSGPSGSAQTHSAGGEVDQEALERELKKKMVAAKLAELYGQAIHHPRVQLQAIERLINILKEIYPDKWQDHVQGYLAAAFPDQADKLFDMFLKFIEFKQWAQDNSRLLAAMGADERKAFLWAKREQFFGADAFVIWEMELKQEEVADTLAAINGQTAAPFSEKVAFYINRLGSIYGEEFENYQYAHQQKLMDQFLGLESVQEDLHQMTAEERGEQLQQFRASMGLDEAALARWSDLDATRDQRWEKGRAYMQAREQIVNEYGGARREAELDALRKSYFGAQADTIAHEEATGLFRFDRKRVYGKN